MPAIPWKQLGDLHPNREYVVLATNLPLVRFSSTPKMLRLTSGIRRQLKSTRGVLGYSMDAKVFARQYSTLSVWESEDALQAFVAHSPHVETMEKMAPEMGDTKFVRWMIQGSDLRPTWADAHRRLLV
jgi:heme-degrading monooxygenase HmoA